MLFSVGLQNVEPLERCITVCAFVRSVFAVASIKTKKYRLLVQSNCRRHSRLQTHFLCSEYNDDVRNDFPHDGSLHLNGASDVCIRM